MGKKKSEPDIYEKINLFLGELSVAGMTDTSDVSDAIFSGLPPAAVYYDIPDIEWTCPNCVETNKNSPYDEGEVTCKGCGLRAILSTDY